MEILILIIQDNITVTATTTFGGSAVTVSTPESGIGTFASVQFDTENPNIKLTFSSGMLTKQFQIPSWFIRNQFLLPGKLL